VNWLGNLFKKHAVLAPEQQKLLSICRAWPVVPVTAPLAELRWVVVDVETSGLDPFHDRLISIGAVEVVGGRIPLTSGFEVLFRQPEASLPGNILVHGIGGNAQRSGVEPVTAMLSFLNYAGSAPLIAFHAAFDRVMIERAARAAIGWVPGNVWLDLAMLAPALLERNEEELPRGLDAWTARLGIVNESRHNALADALATAQLLQAVLARARQSGATSLRDLIKLEKDRRWLERGG
jgi:DNA polymerase-3 subunit epsilon